MAKNNMTKDYKAQTVTFKRTNKVFDLSLVTDEGMITFMKVYGGGVLLDRCLAGKTETSKIPYSIPEQAQIQQDLFDSLVNATYTQRKRKATKGISFREGLANAKNSGLNFDLACQVVCPNLVEEDAKQIWDSIE